MTIVFQNVLFEKDGKKQVGHYMDPTLKANIDEYFIKGVKRKFDGIALITGLEGTGKSTFTKSLAAYCCSHFGNKLKIENIVFDGASLIKRIDACNVGDSIIFDEAIMDMSAQDSSTDMQKILIKKFTLIRKKRLFIFLVIPSFFMLRKYFAVFRTRIMINCYCPDGITRGYFKAYNFSTKKKLYLHGYKEMNMGAAKPNFKGGFCDTTGFFVDEEKYEHKKDLAIEELIKDKNKGNNEIIKDKIELYQVKLKTNVENFKEKTKEKLNAIRKKSVQNKTLVKQKLEEKYKDKISIAEEKMYRSIYFLFKSISENYKLHQEKELTEDIFVEIVFANKTLDMDKTAIKNALKKGKEIVDIII